MKAFVAVGVGLAFVGGSFGLSGSAKTAHVWSCTTAAKHSCAQWDTMIDADTLRERQAGCTRMGGVVAHSPCTTNHSVGTCVADAGARLVYYAGRDARQTRDTCTMLGGTWH